MQQLLHITSADADLKALGIPVEGWFTLRWHVPLYIRLPLTVGGPRWLKVT